MAGLVEEEFLAEDKSRAGGNVDREGFGASASEGETLELFDFSGFGFAGEESAGATFARRDGRVWTTDKDGITAALLSAEIVACTGAHPGVAFERLSDACGRSYYDRVEAKATPVQISMPISRARVGVRLRSRRM